MAYIDRVYASSIITRLRIDKLCIYSITLLSFLLHLQKIFLLCYRIHRFCVFFCNHIKPWFEMFWCISKGNEWCWILTTKSKSYRKLIPFTNKIMERNVKMIKCLCFSEKIQLCLWRLSCWQLSNEWVSVESCFRKDRV